MVSFSDIETSTILIKKSIIEKVGFLDTRLPSEQNHDFFYRLSKVSEFDFLDTIAVIKDAPPVQISKSMKNKIMGYLIFHKKHFNDIKNLSLYNFMFIWVKFCITMSLFLLMGVINKPHFLSNIYEKLHKKGFF